MVIDGTWALGKGPDYDPDDECFHLEIGEHVWGELGEGAGVEAHCVPAIEFTQNWVEEENGRRFWSFVQ